MPTTRSVTKAITTGVVAATTTVCLTGTTPAAAASSKYASIGLSVLNGDTNLLNQARGHGIPVEWARLFTKQTVPASISAIPGAVTAVKAGYKLWISVDAPVKGMASTKFDKQLTSLAKSAPAGTRFTPDHEPSGRNKGITPAAFAAAYNHSMAVMKRANPAILTGPIDVRVNVMTKGYLNGLNHALVKFVGIDGYDGINGGRSGNPFSALAGPVVAYVQHEFPATPVAFAEFGTTRPSGRARWIADALVWARAHNVGPLVLFVALGPYVLTSAEQSQLGAII